MKIELTDNEIILIQEALHAFDPSGTGWEQIDINELADDIREQDARRDDDWGRNLAGHTFAVAEDDFIEARNRQDNHRRASAEAQMFNAGAAAREKMKATSRAAARRLSMSTHLMRRVPRAIEDEG